MRDEETIIACCTAQGNGAIALLRLSGNNVRSIVNCMSKLPKQSILTVPTHTVHYGFVVDRNQEYIDQVLFIVMDAPKTFTGQSVIEITCHNNPFLIEAIIQQAVSYGARIASEGEFSKRAFLSGKIDLVQAEAINELINANNQLALKKSLAQLQGSFSHFADSIEKELVTLLAYCEASFEFLEEERDFGDIIKYGIKKLLDTIQNIKKTFDMQKQIRQGIKIALIGSVNAGKSSIFNMLLQTQRAIVTPIAGTTRDVIEAGIYTDGTYWTLIDTAGIRTTHNIIEQEGIKRSLEEAHKADIILLIIDSSRPTTLEEETIYKKIYHEYESKVIIVQNKIDLVFNNSFLESFLPTVSASCLTVSTTSSQYKNILEQEIKNKIAIPISSPFLLNKRQYTIFLGVEKKLHEIFLMLEKKHKEYELISYHLKDALEHLSELTGKSINEQAMDAVFKQFCVGK